MITQSINLNLIPGGVLPRINVSQYDKGSRALQFVLFNGAVLYSIENGTEITIQGSKPDNTAFQYSCTWSGSTVSMDIEQQMTAVAGEVICELAISNNGEILGTCNFILYVESAAVSDDAVISETDIPLIERAVEAAVEAAQSATDAAASAQAAAQSAASIGIATTSNVGVVKPDGTTITVDSDGTIHGNASAEIATTSDAGIVKPDGTTITVDSDGTIHGNESVTVDTALSTTSENPVQNRVISLALGKVETTIAPVETDPASNAYAVGRQIIFNDNLYEVIAAITAGDALVAYEDDPTNANIKLADPVETQLLKEITSRQTGDTELRNALTNRNLLDNGWFTVNQRGQSSYDSNLSTSPVYTVDRWAVLRGTIDVLTDGGIDLYWNGSQGENVRIDQYLGNEVAKQLNGCNVTISVKTNLGIFSHTINNVVYGTNHSGITLAPGLSVGLNLSWNGKQPLQLFWTGDSSNKLTVYGMKLELGSISTLAMDTAPNYAEELLKCQRYFFLHKGANVYSGYFNTATNFRCSLALPTAMRAIPSISFPNGIDYAQCGIYDAQGAARTPTAIGVDATNNVVGQVDLLLNSAVASHTQNITGVQRFNLSMYISAEL